MIDVIVQGHRYNIIEGLGCYPSIYNVTLAYPILNAPPIIISLVSSVYVGSAIYYFMRQRKEFDAFIGGSTSTFTVDRYLRLMLFSSTETILILPLTIYELWYNATNFIIHPWISWEDTHYHFNRADKYPWILVRADRESLINLNIIYWCVPFAGFTFFGFFGFGPRQRIFYKRVWKACLRIVQPPARVTLPDYPDSTRGQQPTFLRPALHSRIYC